MFLELFIKKDVFFRLHIVFILLILAGCDTKTPFPRCIDATDFSSSDTVAISASLLPDDSARATSDDGYNTNAFGDMSRKQVVRWENTGFITDGSTLNIQALGMWIPVAKGGDILSPADSVSLTVDQLEDGNDSLFGALIPRERECNPYDWVYPSGNKRCNSNACKQIRINKADDRARGFYGMPCWLKNGNGAYVLLKRPWDPEPNATLEVMENPESPVVHIGYDGTDTGGSNMFSSADKQLIDAQCNPIVLERGWQIYVKILDNYYWDNAGGYALRFVSGAVKDSGVYILESIRKEVKKYLIDEGGAIIFKRIVANEIFRNLALSMLSLFLMFSVSKYLFGLVEQPVSQLAIIVIKIIFISLLISENSWDFFHDHIIGVFSEGTDFIIAMVNSGSGIPFDPDAPFASIDRMVQNRIFANTAWNMKMKALIVSDFTGVFGCLIIIIAVLVYLLLLGYAFVIYLTSLVGISLLVAVAPILFLGVLFDRTKAIFDGWITSIVGLCLQAIMIFTLVAMFGSMILNTYYRILGFSTCYSPWFDFKLCIGSLCMIDKTFSTWVPGSPDSKFIKKDLFNDIDDKQEGNARFQFLGGAAHMRVPPDYKEYDYRYQDYPYFDPDSTSNSFLGGTPVVEGSKFVKLAAYLDTATSLLTSRRVSLITEIILTEIRRLKDAGDITQSIADDVIRKISDSVAQNIDVDAAARKLEDPSLPGDNYGQVKEDLKTQIIRIIGSDRLPKPDISVLESQYDYQIIKEIQKGNLIIWPELFILLLMAYLLWTLKELVQRTGKAISGIGAFPGAILGDAYSGLFDPRSGGIGGKIGGVISGVKYQIQNKANNFLSGQVTFARKLVGIIPEVPVVSTLAKGSFSAAKAITGMGSDAARDLKQKHNLRKINYVRAVIGGHLMGIGQPITSPGKGLLNLLKGVASNEGLAARIAKKRNFMVEKIRDQILGPEARVDKLPNQRGDEKLSAEERKELAKEKRLSAYDDEYAIREVFEEFNLRSDGNVVIDDMRTASRLAVLRSKLLGLTPENAEQALLINEAINRIDSSLKGKYGNEYKDVLERENINIDATSTDRITLTEDDSAQSPNTGNRDGIGDGDRLLGANDADSSMVTRMELEESSKEPMSTLGTTNPALGPPESMDLDVAVDPSGVARGDDALVSGVAAPDASLMVTSSAFVDTSVVDVVPSVVTTPVSNPVASRSGSADASTSNTLSAADTVNTDTLGQNEDLHSESLVSGSFAGADATPSATVPSLTLSSADEGTPERTYSSGISVDSVNLGSTSDDSAPPDSTSFGSMPPDAISSSSTSFFSASEEFEGSSGNFEANSQVATSAPFQTSSFGNKSGTSISSEGLGDNVEVAGFGSDSSTTEYGDSAVKKSSSVFDNGPSATGVLQSKKDTKEDFASDNLGSSVPGSYQDTSLGSTNISAGAGFGGNTAGIDESSFNNLSSSGNIFTPPSHGDSSGAVSYESFDSEVSKSSDTNTFDESEQEGRSEVKGDKKFKGSGTVSGAAVYAELPTVGGGNYKDQGLGIEQPSSYSSTLAKDTPIQDTPIATSLFDNGTLSSSQGGRLESAVEVPASSSQSSVFGSSSGFDEEPSQGPTSSVFTQGSGHKVVKTTKVGKATAVEETEAMAVKSDTNVARRNQLSDDARAEMARTHSAKKQELENILSDKNISEDERQNKTVQLQAEISALEKQINSEY